MSEVKYMGKRLIFAVGEHVVAFPAELMDLLAVASHLEADQFTQLARQAIQK